MNNKKYEILMDEENTIEWKGHTLHRIRALRDFNDVREGEMGGYVENDYNLSHKGNCWIYDEAKAMDDSRLYDNSWSGARQTLDDISNADLEEEFMQYLDEIFGADEVGDTELNDFIWFERDTIYDYLGLDENGEIPKDDEDDEEE